MRQYLESQIAERDEKIARLKREIVTAEAERSALSAALAHHDAEERKSKIETQVEQVEQRDEIPPAPQPNASSFQMSEHWAEILRRLDAKGHSFGASEVLAMATSVGKPMKMPNVRSQIAYYKRRKVLRRTTKGRYVLADAGREMLEKAAGSDVGFNASDTDPPDEIGPRVRVVQ